MGSGGVEGGRWVEVGQGCNARTWGGTRHGGLSNDWPMGPLVKVSGLRFRCRWFGPHTVGSYVGRAQPESVGMTGRKRTRVEKAPTDRGRFWSTDVQRDWCAWPQTCSVKSTFWAIGGVVAVRGLHPACCALYGPVTHKHRECVASQSSVVNRTCQGTVSSNGGFQPKQ